MDQQDEPVFIPTVQDTITFHEKPLIAVCLANGNYGVVLRWMCENLHLDTHAQVQRIRRTPAMADGLIYVRVQTDGGPQVMPTLILRAVPYWLATIDMRRMDKNDPRWAEILEYQRHAADALYEWARSVRDIRTSTSMVSAEQIIKPTAPSDDASLDEWSEYHLQMLKWISWRRDMVQWRDNIDTRVGKLETVTSRILEQIGPQRITPEQQMLVQYYVSELSKATNKSHQTIFAALKTAFRVPHYDEIPASEWQKVEQWFKQQMPGQELPPTQGKLF